MIAIVSAALLFAAAPSPAAEIRIGDTPARRIAKDATIRGKNEKDQCLPFAHALHAKFQAAGIPSKVISFNYETLSNQPPVSGDPRDAASVNGRGGRIGAHAVVLYEDHGRTYVMDNQSWQPLWIHKASLVAMAQQFSGMNIVVGSARDLESRPRGAIRWAHLSARPRSVL